MKNHTSFKIGGPADLLVLPDDANKLSRIVEICKEEKIPCYVMGNGTNLLVSDKGYRGVIVKLYRNFSGLTVKGDMIEADAGLTLTALANAAQQNGLTGLEFASGIPGTVGGACFMNAGAYDGEIKKVFREADILTVDGSVKTFSNEDMQFDYRHSVLEENGGIVIRAVFKLHPGDKDAIKNKADGFNAKRRETQPLNLPNAGSAFKRPEGLFAGKLIMDSGLRGYTIGGASVSEKHCGFIVNNGGATASDVINLIAHIQTVVKERFGVELTREIRILGEA